MTPETAEGMEPQPARMSEFSRILGVFFEPKKTFTDIAQRPTWVVPIVISLICAIGVVTLIGQHIGWERVLRQQFEASSRIQQMPADQREQALQLQMKIAPVGAYVAAMLTVVLLDVVVAAVLLGIAGGIMSGGLRFRQVFSVVAYARLTGVIASILTGVVIFLKNPDEFNINNPLAFNVGAFLDPNGTSKFAYAFASSLDLFTFWTIFLLATGLKAAAGKRLTFTGALIAVAAPWILLALGRSALAAVAG